MIGANFYLNFNGDTEEAFRFYQSVFGGELTIVRFRDFKEMPGVDQLSEEDRNKIGHCSLPLYENILMGTDALESFGQSVTFGNNFHITVEPESADDARRLFSALSEGGEVEMELDGPTEWAELFGSCCDKFGVRWMINYTGSVEFKPAG